MPKTFDNGVWTSEIANRMAAGLKPLVRNEILQYMEKMGTYGATDQEIEEKKMRRVKLKDYICHLIPHAPAPRTSP